jgi:hypothetical protein
MKYRLGCCLMRYFCFHRLGCRLDGRILVSMDLVVILWKILFRRLGCRLMENFSFHGLGCCPMESFVFFFFFFLVTIDLIVVLWMCICMYPLP